MRVRWKRACGGPSFASGMEVCAASDHPFDDRGEHAEEGSEGCAWNALPLGGLVKRLFAWRPEHVAAPPHRFDVIFAAACKRKFLTQLANKDIDDL